MLIEPSLVKLLKGKKLLIFDFDGTVADTTPLHAAAFEQVLSPLQIAVSYPSIAGMKTKDAIGRCALESGTSLNSDQIQSLVLAKQALVRQMIADKLHPMAGVDRFLRWAMLNYQLSMATAGSRGTVSLALRILGYENYFNPMVCAEDVRNTKPHPEAFECVLAETGHTPKQALVFEDSEAGLEAARIAGIESVRIHSDSWIKFFKDRR